MAAAPRIPTPLAQRLRDLLGTPLTVGVWIASVLVVVTLLTHRGERVRYSGIARASYHEVSALRVGRIVTIVVGLYERVEAGEVVAVLDSKPLRARLATARGELLHIDAELSAALDTANDDVSRAAREHAVDRRRFSEESANRLLDELRLNVTIETDQIEAQLVVLRLRQIAALQAQGDMPEVPIDDLELRHNRLRTRIEANRILLANVHEQYLKAREREREFTSGAAAAADPEPGPVRTVRAALEVQRRQIDELRLEREALVLRSPVTGQVSAVRAGNGQAILAGEPVLTVARSVVTEVVGYASATDPEIVTAGQSVWLARAADPGHALESVVARVSPTVALLPERLWSVAGSPEYGRAFVVPAAAPLELVPDEAVHIRVVRN